MPSYRVSGADINAGTNVLVRGQDTTLAIFPTDGAVSATVQGSVRPGYTWATAVIAVLRGNNIGGPFVALSTPANLTAAGMTAEIDTSAHAYAALQITTPEGSTSLADFEVFMNQRNA